LRTKVGFGAMFIKVASIGPAAAARKGARALLPTQLWMFREPAAG
jgi:hypothetical protein